MTEHAVRQQGTALQKGAATEDRQEKKTAQAAASAKNREDGVPQQELERFARFLLPTPNLVWHRASALWKS